MLNSNTATNLLCEVTLMPKHSLNINVFISNNKLSGLNAHLAPFSF